MCFRNGYRTGVDIHQLKSQTTLSSQLAKLTCRTKKVFGSKSVSRFGNPSRLTVEQDEKKGRRCRRLGRLNGSSYFSSQRLFDLGKFSLRRCRGLLGVLNTPFLSMTNAARAEVSPTPANIGNTTS